MAETLVLPAPSAKSLGKRKMEYREDGTPVVTQPPVPAPAPAPHVPRLLATARAAAPAVPDTSQDEVYAKMLQEEADEEAHDLREQQRQHREQEALDKEEYDLFGDNDWDGALTGCNLDAMVTETSCVDDEDVPLNVSQVVRERRARLQREIFGPDEDDDVLWDFNGSEWVQISSRDVIGALGAVQGNVHSVVKTEVEDVAVPIHLEPTDCIFFPPPLVPLSNVVLNNAVPGEAATGQLSVQRSSTPHPMTGVTDFEPGEELVPDVD